MSATFEIDRDAIPEIAKDNWRLRSNGTAMTWAGQSLKHKIFTMFNGWTSRRIICLDGNPLNLKASNLRAII